MEKRSLIRILILLVLSTIIYYFISFDKIELNPLLTEHKLQEIPDIDTVITKILEKYEISRENVYHKKISFANSNFVRDEIIVNIPVTVSRGYNSTVKDDTLILLIHFDLKNELSKYNFRVSGVENTLDKVTTLFIENEKKKIIKTIVFKILIRKERSYSYQLKNKKG